MPSGNAANGWRLTLSWRIGLPLSRDDGRFERLARFLDENRRVVDEVAFFETLTHHLYLPMEYLEEVAAILARRIETLKGNGVKSVGINVLTTIGHINEGWDHLPPLPFQPMIGHDGSVAKSCACPNDPRMLEYVARKYALMAGARPDFIWVDDDIRMHHHGVTFACFCPTCLHMFAETTGEALDRESLVARLRSPEGAVQREAWIEQNARVIESLMAHVEKAIHAVRPSIKTGLMTAGPRWTTYSGSAFERWFTALGATKARPGGGFYVDERPIDMYTKAQEMARQCVILPGSVTDRQYELENFPYSSLGKSVATMVNECSLALAAGCNGVAFNAIGSADTEADFAAKMPMARAFADARPFWEQIVAKAQGLPLSGLWPAWHPRLMGRRDVTRGEDWFGFPELYDIGKPEALARLGLPMAAERGDGVFLAGRVAEAFTREQLSEMLSGPVLMDAFALEVLAKRGLGDLAGVRVAGWTDNGMAERLTNDPLNGSCAGMLRDIRSEFWGDPFLKSARLEPLSASVRVLSVLEMYLGGRHEPCVTAFENKRGGRVAVMGHAPWRFAEVKREQVLNMADWATRGTLPVRVSEVVPLAPMVRLSQDHRSGVILLLNAGLDSIDRATVEVRAPRTDVTLGAPGRRPVPLNAQTSANVGPSL